MRRDNSSCAAPPSTSSAIVAFVGSFVSPLDMMAMVMAKMNLDFIGLFSFYFVSSLCGSSTGDFGLVTDFKSFSTKIY